jgi:CubicO group peptidase (beta-lactamase class C family)
MLDPRLIKWSSATGKTLQNDSYSLEGYTMPLIFEPGEGWAYGIGLDWVSHLVSVLTDSTFEAYLAKHVFEPLEMSSTTFRLAERPDLIQRRSAIALRAEPNGPLSAGGADPVPEKPPMASGGSGPFSTANDYAKLLGALVKGDGGILQARVCSRAVSAAVTAQQVFDGDAR